MNAKRKEIVDNLIALTAKCNQCGAFYSTVFTNRCTKCQSKEVLYTSPPNKEVIESLVNSYIKTLENEIAEMEGTITILKDKTDYPEAFVRPTDGLVFVLNKNNRYVSYDSTKDSDKYEYSYEALVKSKFYPIRKEMLEVR